jgi:hypothetical protein
MTIQMDKRHVSGVQTDQMDHFIQDTTNGWSKFARLVALPVGKTYVTLTGDQANDLFGFSVSTAGDVNDDGYNDVIVGAPGADKAYIFAGDYSMAYSIDAANATVVLSGGANTDFGWSVANCSDVNSANYEDVIVGAPGYNSNQGRAYIFDGSYYNDIVTANYLDDSVSVFNGTSSGWEGSFALEAGDGLRSVFIGDANNDGHDDIVTADWADDKVRIINGTITGEWESNYTLSAPGSPWVVVIGDANNDGLNDIVVNDYDNDKVTIYNGTSSGGWEPIFQLSVGDYPRSVTIGDANNDGYNDILTSDVLDNTVSILNGTSSGGWEAKGTLSTGNYPRWVRIGDANNDGYNDIVTANSNADTISIYNGTSSGSWEPIFTLSVGDDPRCVFIGDANNDGYNDIVVSDYGADDTVSIYNGTNDNGWEAKGTLDVGTNPTSVFVADANNDGYNDILTSDYAADTVSIYNGTSGNSWEAKGTLSTGSDPHFVFVGNANNDVMGGSIGVADANLTLTGESTGDKFGYSVHYAGDIDGDGYPDVVVGAPHHTNDSKTECGAVYVYRGGSALDATADYTNYGDTAYDHFGWSVSFAGDVDGSGNEGVLVGAPGYDDTTPNPDNDNSGKAYVLIIPEFGIVAIPMVTVLVLFAWNRRRRRRRSRGTSRRPIHSLDA